MKNKNHDLKKLFLMISAAFMLCTAAACSSQSSGSEGSSGAGTVSATQSAAESSDAPSTAESSDAPSAAESAAKSSDAPSAAESAAESSDAPSAAESAGSSDVTSENVSIPDVSGSESSVSYGTENMAHPNDLVGKWSLKLETSGLESSGIADAEQRMKNTSITLKLDGSAVGDYGGSAVAGAWGVQSGYVYIILGDATEVFTYYIDTLVSVNYPGMYFVK